MKDTLAFKFFNSMNRKILTGNFFYHIFPLKIIQKGGTYALKISGIFFWEAGIGHGNPSGASIVLDLSLPIERGLKYRIK